MNKNINNKGKLKGKIKSKNNVISLEMNADFLFERGIKSLEKMDHKSALKYFKRATEIEPLNSIAHSNLAGVYAELGDYKQSNNVLFKVINTIDRNAHECFYFIANNYANMGDFQRAAVHARKYLSLQSTGEYAEDAQDMLDFFDENGYFENDEELAAFEVPHKLIESGKNKEAVLELEKMLEEQPDNLHVRNSLALTNFYIGNNERALQELQALLKIDPENLHAHCNLAFFYSELGETDKLQQQLQRLRAVTPMFADDLWKLAITMGLLGEHKLAYKHFTSMTKRLQGTDDGQVAFLRGVAAVNIGDVEKALQIWKRALSHDPENEVVKFYIYYIEEELAGNSPLQADGEGLNYYNNMPYVELTTKIANEMKKPAAMSSEQEFKQSVSNLIRSSLLWTIKNSEQFEKTVEALQLLGNIFDDKIRDVLLDYLLADDVSLDLKKIALVVLHQNGVPGNYAVKISSKLQHVSEEAVEELYRVWQPEWVEVLQIALASMEDYIMENEQIRYDVENVWSAWLAEDGENLRKHSIDTKLWAATLEYAILRLHNKKIKQKDIAEKYGLDKTRLSKNYQKIKIMAWGVVNWNDLK